MKTLERRIQLTLIGQPTGVDGVDPPLTTSFLPVIVSGLSISFKVT